MNRRARLAATAACGLLAGACVSTPPPAPQSNAGEVLRIEAQAAAERVEAAGEVTEAIWRWRIVEALAADPGPAREHIRALEARRTERAQALAAQGRRLAAGPRPDPDGAAAAFRAALALDPALNDVREALRRQDGAEALRAVAHSRAGGPDALPVERRAGVHASHSPS